MSRKLIAFVVLILAGAAAAVVMVLRREPAAPDPGIPLALAEDRAARVSALKYDLDFTIPASRDQPVRGRLTASFTLQDAGRALAFDFAQPGDHLLGVTANAQTIAARVQNGHVMIPCWPRTAW